MKFFLFRKQYLFFCLIFLNASGLRAEDFSKKSITHPHSQILIESSNQKSDLKKSMFYAEGDVIITNKDKDFIAKSKEAIFYKSSGKIKLLGHFEVITNNSISIKAGEIFYYLKENKFEAIADFNQRVNTKILVNENKIINQKIEK